MLILQALKEKHRFSRHVSVAPISLLFNLSSKKELILTSLGMMAGYLVVLLVSVGLFCLSDFSLSTAPYLTGLDA
jgi:hypothetical protein